MKHRRIPSLDTVTKSREPRYWFVFDLVNCSLLVSANAIVSLTNLMILLKNASLSFSETLLLGKLSASKALCIQVFACN